jgi:hypothetical protein
LAPRHVAGSEPSGVARLPWGPPPVWLRGNLPRGQSESDSFRAKFPRRRAEMTEPPSCRWAEPAVRSAGQCIETRMVFLLLLASDFPRGGLHRPGLFGKCDALFFFFSLFAFVSLCVFLPPNHFRVEMLKCWRSSCLFLSLD